MAGRRGGRCLRRWLLVAVVVAGPLAQAGVYRWVDGNGRVHFGDRPPSGAGEEVTLPAAEPPRRTVEEQRREEERRRTQQRLLDLYQDERRAAAAAREQERREEAVRERRCREAQKRLAGYERAQGLYERLPDGSRRYLSGPERRAETEKARQEVKRWCGDGG